MKAQTTKTMSQQQVKLLAFVYRFRHVTTRQIQVFIGKKQVQQAQQRINPLLKQGYVGRKYGSNERQSNSYAAYFLLPKGISTLRQNDTSMSRDQLNQLYRDRTASENFSRRQIMIGDVYVELKELYQSGLGFFTKTELRTFSYFPSPLPSAYVVIQEQNQQREIFLEVYLATTQSFVIRKRVRQYLNYIEDGVWERATGTEHPLVLIWCENETLEKRIQGFIKDESKRSATSAAQAISTRKFL